MFQIFKEPLTSIITKIDNTKESMFLMGTKGVGKSTILNYYYAQNNNRVINGTFTYSDNLFFNDQRLNKI